MPKPGISRRDLPLALAGSLGAAATVAAQDTDTSPQPSEISPLERQWQLLEQRYELNNLAEVDRATILARLIRQRARSEALREFPLSSAAEPATVFLAAPGQTHGGSTDAD